MKFMQKEIRQTKQKTDRMDSNFGIAALIGLATVFSVAFAMDEQEIK